LFQPYLKRVFVLHLRLRDWSRRKASCVEKRRTSKWNCRKRKSSWLKPNRNKKSWKSLWVPQKLELDAKTW